MNLKYFEKNGKDEIRRKKFVFVGNGCVGKTSLIVRWATGMFYYRPMMFDNHVKCLEMDGIHYEVGLWDTAGQDEYDRLRPLSYPRTDLFIIMFSCDSRDSFENIENKWLPEIRRHCGDTSIDIVLICSKCDLRREEGDLETFVSIEEAEELAAMHPEILTVLENSSLEDINLEESLNACLRASCIREEFPFKYYNPFRVGDWVYARRKGKWNIATIQDIKDDKMKVFYFERQYWFNHHSVLKRADVKPVEPLDMIRRLFATFQPFGLEILETIAEHIAEYLT